MKVELKFDCSNIDWQAIHRLLEEAGMATYPPEILRRAFENSYAVAFVFEGSKLIGSGRAISDGAYQAALYDFAVLPDYQGKGIGRMIMNAILGKLAGFNIILYATPGKEGFYDKFSFRRMRTGMALFMKQPSMTQRGFTE